MWKRTGCAFQVCAVWYEGSFARLPSKVKVANSAENVVSGGQLMSYSSS